MNVVSGPYNEHLFSFRPSLATAVAHANTRWWRWRPGVAVFLQGVRRVERVDMNNRTLLVLGQGDPRHRDTWSGIPAQLLPAFEKSTGVTINAVDVESGKLTDLMSKVMNFSPTRERWAARHHYGPFLVGVRSRRATAEMARHSGPTLQFGAQFLTTGSTDQLYLYCDANVLYGARSPYPKRSDYLTEREVAVMVDRERQVYAAARTIFVFSEALKRSFINDFGISPDKVIVVGAGVNLDLPDPKDLKNGPQLDSPPTILFVGREYERKGGPDLVKAFKSVRAQIPDARLQIAGCRINISDPGVEVIGPIERTPEGRAVLAKLYRSADIFCMPSLYEPFGIVFAEAMMFGLPCVGTNQNAMPEVIAEGTGWLVPPGDVAALASTLVDALRERRRLFEMGRTARERALALFTWPHVAARMTEHMFGSAV